MKIETQAPPVNWMIIPKEKQDRIVNLLRQLVRRRIDLPARRRSEENERKSSESNIDKSMQQWENLKSPSRSTCDCICQAVNNATDRAAPGINTSSIRFGHESNTFGLAVSACESN